MFNAYKKDDSGITNISRWQQVEKTTGIKPEGLRSKPYLPDELNYLWEEYIEIRRGCENIDYVGIEAYCRLTGSSFTPWEVSVMLELDCIRKRNG